MTLSAVAKRYARALVDVVAAPGKDDAAAVVGELRAFETTLEGSPELLNALVSPAVPPSRKRAVVGRIAEGLGLGRIARNFLLVLVDHRRIAALPDIIQSIELVLDERMGFARAEITSAGELNSEQRTILNTRLEELTGRRIRPQYAVDPELIGGVTALIGSTVYDGSVRGQLEALERRLSAEG